MKVGISGKQREALALALALDLPRESVLCDIGAGNGGVVNAYREAGFMNSFGVEHSRYRAALAKERFGFEYLVGEFGGSDLAEKLAQKKRVNLFFSYHVFEHLYDPDEAFAAMAKVQEEGDYVVLAVPNGYNEPVPTTLFWLPHLHGYTPMTLELLFNRHGYEVVGDLLEYPENIIIIAQKRTAASRRYALEKKNAPEYFLERFETFFHVDELAADTVRKLSWYKKGKGVYPTALSWSPGWRAFDRLLTYGERVVRFFLARVFRVFSNKRSVVISGREAVDGQTTPLAITFEGPIEMLIR